MNYTFYLHNLPIITFVPYKIGITCDEINTWIFIRVSNREIKPKRDNMFKFYCNLCILRYNIITLQYWSNFQLIAW